MSQPCWHPQKMSIQMRLKHTIQRIVALNGENEQNCCWTYTISISPK
nr:unnamed protein product [Callosobruchus analis]